jgi:APA family basic amino acid/polyamine antiporter
VGRTERAVKPTSGDAVEVEDRHPQDRLRRTLSLTDATLLCVASVIGSGIFLAPGAIADLLPHPGLVLSVWLAGGALSLAGALANAELGAMYPHAGGDYVYLREAFHPAAGFMVGWLTFFAIYVGTIGTLATGFAGAFSHFVPLSPDGELTLALGMTVAMSALNYAGVRAGAGFNNLTTVIKISGLIAFVFFGLLLGTGHVENFSPLVSRASEVPLTQFGLALSPVLFSYLGWNAAVYVASEIRDPKRNVPRALFLGLALCTAIYLLVNAVYLYAVPAASQRGVSNMGEAAAAALFGPLGGTLVAAFVLASILGTLNATILVGPRIAYAMAIDGRFFGGVDRVHATFDTPHVAIVVQCVASIAILLVLRSFQSNLDFTTFGILLATMADTAALYALRIRQPDRVRPYRAWGYPWVPALYFVGNAGIALVMLHGRPRECAIALLVAATGVPFYLFFARRGAGRRGAGAG